VLFLGYGRNSDARFLFLAHMLGVRVMMMMVVVVVEKLIQHRVPED
jgi:hypothetical protein